jgi:hypothetical protein
MLIDDPLDPPKPAKRFRIYRVVRGEPYSLIAEYDSEEELLEHRVRLDRHESLRFSSKTGIEYVSVQKYQQELREKKNK